MILRIHVYKNMVLPALVCTFVCAFVAMMACAQSDCPNPQEPTQENSSRRDTKREKANSPKPQLFERLGRIESKLINESSGVTLATTEQTAIWTINDSGGGTRLYCVGMTGKTLLETNLKSANNRDWEAMTSYLVDGQQHLLVADVGDNGFKRKTYQLYTFAEPKISRPKIADPNSEAEKKSATEIEVSKIEFTYQDGSHNCEAVSVNPLTGKLWLIEKVYLDSTQNRPPGVYELDFQSENEEDVVAVRIGEFQQRNVTGMAFSADGKRLIIRNYLNAHLLQRPDDMTWLETLAQTKPVAIPLPLQRQGEAVCFSADAKFAIITSEIKNQPIWKINLDLYLEQASKNMKSD